MDMKDGTYIYDSAQELYEPLIIDTPTPETPNKKSIDEEALQKIHSDTKLVVFLNGERSNSFRARKCPNLKIKAHFREKRGTEANPVESLSEFLEVVEIKKKKLGERKFFLFRGTPTHFELCGRIKFDAQYLRDFKKILEVDGVPLLHRSFVEEIEKTILSNYTKRSRAYLPNPPRSKWEEITLARHHGLPTRILDWSRDPLIGLWFAVTNEPQFRSRHSIVSIFYPNEEFLIAQEENDFCEFGPRKIIPSPFELDVLEVKNNPSSQEFDEKKKKVSIKEDIALYRPPSINPRIDFQSSWFTVHPFIAMHQDKRDKKQVYGQYASLEKYTDNFDKIYIKSDKTYSIRDELSRIGINEVAVYQDLDHLGAYIKSAHFKQSDEIFSDESLYPKNLLRSFNQLQSTLALYNSEEVKQLHFLNLKGVYQKLVRILANKTKFKTKLWTFNDMNRDFHSYGSQREVFLRLLEEAAKGIEFDYKRIQFLDCDIANIDAPVEKTNIKKLMELFNVFFVRTDNISRQHVDNMCNLLGNDWIKYLFNDNAEGKERISYTLLEYSMNTPHAQSKQDVYLHIIIELNSTILPDFIGHDQDMCFWIELKPTNKSSKKKIELFKAYEEDFKHLFNLQKNENSLSRDFIRKKLGKIRKHLIDNHSDKYLKLLIGRKSEGIKFGRPFLIDITSKVMFHNLQAFLDYVFHRIKSSKECQELYKDTQALTPFRLELKENEKQNEVGWYLMVCENGDDVVCKNPEIHSNSIVMPSGAGYKSSSYERFYLHNLDDLEIKNGIEVRLIYKD